MDIYENRLSEFNRNTTLFHIEPQVNTAIPQQTAFIDGILRTMRLFDYFELVLSEIRTNQQF